MKVSDEKQLLAAVQGARATKTALEIVGNGTKRRFGRQMEGAILDVSAVRGILAYEPEELIVTVRPGTPIAELNAALAEKGQRLGFEPPEWSGLFGAEGSSTIGGVVSVDAAGPARVRYGGARDQLLGIRAVNGFGESFKAGGRVVKNVTGFDIPKLVCGAFGTLCVLTEMTFRVFPKPSLSTVLEVRDIGANEGLALLRRVWSSPLESTGLAYVPKAMTIGASEIARQGSALVRLEGERIPLDEKITYFKELTGRRFETREEGQSAFTSIANGSCFAGSNVDLWRVHLPPASAAAFLAEIAPERWVADWSGAVIWTEVGPERDVRGVAARAGGHAILVRASGMTRGQIPVFPPESTDHAALTRAVKSAFDPLSLFNRSRMWEDV